jgi:hypothetical protein
MSRRIVRHDPTTFIVLGDESQDLTTNAVESDYEDGKLRRHTVYKADGSVLFEVDLSQDDEGQVTFWVGSTRNAKGEPHWASVVVPRLDDEVAP